MGNHAEVTSGAIAASFCLARSDAVLAAWATWRGRYYHLKTCWVPRDIREVTRKGNVPGHLSHNSQAAWILTNRGFTHRNNYRRLAPRSASRNAIMPL